jgi:hypothetical protein
MYLLNVYLKDVAFADGLGVMHATVRCVDGKKLTRRAVHLQAGVDPSPAPSQCRRR